MNAVWIRVIFAGHMAFIVSPVLNHFLIQPVEILQIGNQFAIIAAVGRRLPGSLYLSSDASCSHSNGMDHRFPNMEEVQGMLASPKSWTVELHLSLDWHNVYVNHSTPSWQAAKVSAADI